MSDDTIRVSLDHMAPQDADRVLAAINKLLSERDHLRAQLSACQSALTEACDIAEQSIVELGWPGTARIAELRKLGVKP